MISRKKWTSIVVIFTAFLILSIATINYLVDPYGIYHFSSKHYNAQKIAFRDLFQFKTFHIKKHQPEAIILGTSRSMRLQPSVIESLTGESTYNLGIYGSVPYIYYKYLEYTLKVNDNLKSVYIGLDYETFNESYPINSSYNEKRLNTTFYTNDLFSTLLSEKALKDSYKVFIDNRNHSNKYTTNEFLADGTVDETYVSPFNTIQDTFHWSQTAYHLSSDSMLYIKKIKELCDQNGIALNMYISPLHSILLETHWQIDQWSNYEEWKRKLVQISPVWDFSGYHQISMSSLQDKENYNDLGHFSKKVGNYIIHRMLNPDTDQAPSYFGTYMTKENIDVHLAKLRISREKWPEQDKNMIELAPNY
ncbi:hypothetical protein I6N90_16560 [Paenibacillus sp. GSMTC-2017]|uniref:hypothetical protein n=1 Tax=Paenibacillus sp. GSMTC-2017 TaxID=2794350 RepID=UPI0018D9D430|nr:hypothetical protein [Paenibacillus sp. GSMTC-2017]MBH5319410.1 hypothetical protein [Paenibacillus sp. GSMTC-2017]